MVRSRLRKKKKASETERSIEEIDAGPDLEFFAIGEVKKANAAAKSLSVVVEEDSSIALDE